MRALFISQGGFMAIVVWALLFAVGLADGNEFNGNGRVVLDGKVTTVHWDDGDTFTVVETRKTARLAGYNTLESYGPVHRFGPGPAALAQLAADATAVATQTEWTCSTLKGSGGYGRIQVDCPKLRNSLLAGGLAHTFAVGDSAPADAVQEQAKAIEARKGMWTQGAPEILVTSVHSLDEKPGATETYNRVVSTTDGRSEKRTHTKIYKACSWVCEGTSCLLYVPYGLRYGEGKAECLK